MCDCMTARNTHPKEKTCNRCFGTGYIGGFDQYINKRRNDSRVLIRFKETAEEIAPDPLNVDRIILNRLFHQTTDFPDKKNTN